MNLLRKPFNLLLTICLLTAAFGLHAESAEEKGLLSPKRARHGISAGTICRRR